MNNLPNIGGENGPSILNLDDEEGLITNTLPIHLFEEILSYLNVLDTQSASQVSKLWNVSAIDTAKHEELVEINKFIKFICGNIEESSYPTQIKDLRALIGDKKILNAVNLNQVKYSALEIREKILNVLKDLDNKVLSALEKLSINLKNPVFFQNVFELARIYRNADEIKELDEGIEKDRALKLVYMELLENRCFDKALEVANLMPLEREKDLAFLGIGIELLKRGYFDKALKITDLITDKWEKSSFLKRVGEALLKNGHLGKTLEVANLITQEQEKCEILESLSKAWTEKGNFDKALEVANLITSEQLKSYALEDIKKARNKK